jgi:hypothetical protein
MYFYRQMTYKEPVEKIVKRKVVESTVIDPKKKDTTIGLLLM